MDYFENTSDVTLTEAEVEALYFVLVAEIDRLVGLRRKADNDQFIEKLDNRIEFIYGLRAKIVGDRTMGMPID